MKGATERRWHGWIGAALILLGSVAGAEAPPDPSLELQVGVRVAPPFVVRTEQGFDGIAIELWEEIARSNGWRFRYQAFGLQSLFDAAREQHIDVAVGALSVTSDREKSLDFSQPFAQGGLGIATAPRSSAWQALLAGLFSWRFLAWVAGLVLTLAAVGAIAWLLERRANPAQFGGRPWHGIGSGFWWAAVTMSTVGYGDKAPVSFAGRLLALIWMFAAILLVSVFTAGVSATLTVGALEGQVTTVDDLRRVRVASIEGSTGARWLAARRIASIGMPDAEAALEQLAAGKVLAVVHDAPILQFLVQRSYPEQLTVLPQRLDRQYYAFALPEGRPELREAIDCALLEAIEDPRWHAKLQRYLGTDE
ncbi:MAG: transporter substrate-binding domain-containing protein [Rhodanobacteraceae bacterium]|nr:transporter substrate-binding domain-containing protein [Rhodanobacteraceae bacterium]